jgi:hypothetical protein
MMSFYGVNPGTPFEDHVEDSGAKDCYDVSSTDGPKTGQVACTAGDFAPGETQTLNSTDGTVSQKWSKDDNDGSGNARSKGGWVYARSGPHIAWTNQFGRNKQAMSIQMNGIGSGHSQIIIAVYELKRFWDELKANPLRRLDEEWLRKKHWQLKWDALLQYKPWAELEMIDHLVKRGVNVFSIRGMDTKVATLKWRKEQYDKFGREPKHVYDAYYGPSTNEYNERIQKARALQPLAVI